VIEEGKLDTHPCYKFKDSAIFSSDILFFSFSVFVPSENNSLLPLLLARGINGESPGAEKRTKIRSQPSKHAIKTEASAKGDAFLKFILHRLIPISTTLLESDMETTKLARSKAPEKKRASMDMILLRLALSSVFMNCPRKKDS
jgi:hypothetical protein